MGSEAAELDDFRVKRRRDESLNDLHGELEESVAFSKQLEELMAGGSIDLQVGDSYLSSFLKDVPRLQP